MCDFVITSDFFCQITMNNLIWFENLLSNKNYMYMFIVIPKSLHIQIGIFDKVDNCVVQHVKYMFIQLKCATWTNAVLDKFCTI